MPLPDGERGRVKGSVISGLVSGVPETSPFFSFILLRK